MAGPIIYLCDQNAQDRSSTCEILRSGGARVQIFASGEEAIEASNERPPNLFITSMGLAGKLDGLGYVRALKADEKLREIPVILLSGAQRVLNMPFRFTPDPESFPVFDVVEKPARPAYLLEVVQKALGS